MKNNLPVHWWDLGESGSGNEWIDDSFYSIESILPEIKRKFIGGKKICYRGNESYKTIHYIIYIGKLSDKKNAKMIKEIKSIIKEENNA